MFLEFITVKRSANFISCCVLHNLCIMNNDDLNDIDEVDIDDVEYNERHIYNEQNPNDRIQGEIKNIIYNKRL